jgi:dethiobiotin synthetase
MAVRGCFVTGTDTEIGKTWFATSLVRGLRARALRVGVMKPVAAGAIHTADGLRNEDAIALIAASGQAWSYEAVNPYCLREPVSPHLAAAHESVTIELPRLARAAEALGSQSDYLVVEGAGGWRAPLGAGISVADLAQVIDLPVVLVVGMRLGCLNHAVLSWEAIGASGCRRAGWVANQIDPMMAKADENRATLAQLLGAPPLAELSYGQTEASHTLALNACIDRLMAL